MSSSNGGDLSGEYAFDRVLDAAMEARGDVLKMRERVVDAESRISQAHSRIDDLQREVRKGEDNWKTAEPLLKELWEAADACLSGIPSENEERPQLKRLRAALEVAGPYCGQPPF